MESTLEKPKGLSKAIIMDQPITLYRYRMLGGTHTQDELFLLSPSELQEWIEQCFIEIPVTCRTRRQVEKYLNMKGFGREKTYYRNEEFLFWKDISREYIGKIVKIGTGNSTPPEMQPRPGETKLEFATRMMELAQREMNQAQLDEHERLRQQRTSNDKDEQGSDPTINAINQNRDMFLQSQAIYNEKPYLPVAFETFTLEQLKEYAQDNEINVEGCKTKTQFVSRLRGEASLSMDGA
jgi:hypothetical protein